MASQKNYFSKAEEYQTKINTGLKCPVKYYNRKVNPYRYSNKQVINGLNSIKQKEIEIYEQLQNLKYNKNLLNQRSWKILYDL